MKAKEGEKFNRMAKDFLHFQAIVKDALVKGDCERAFINIQNLVEHRVYLVEVFAKSRWSPRQPVMYSIGPFGRGTLAPIEEDRSPRGKAERFLEYSRDALVDLSRVFSQRCLATMSMEIRRSWPKRKLGCI